MSLGSVYMALCKVPVQELSSSLGQDLKARSWIIIYHQRSSSPVTPLHRGSKA